MGGRNGGTWTAASHAAAVRAHVRPSSASLVTTSRLAVWPAPCAAASDRVEAGAPRPAACTATRTGTHVCAPLHARAHRCAHTRALPHVQHTRAHGCAHVHTPHAQAHLCARTCSLHAHGHWRRGHTRSSIPINSGKNSPTPGAALNVHRRETGSCVALSHSCTAATIQTPRETRGRNLNEVGNGEGGRCFH